MSLLCTKSKRRLGIDISSHAIKLLELSKTRHQYRVENFGFFLFEEPILSDGYLIDPQNVVQGIRHLFKETKSCSKKAITALPDACTLRKIITASRHLKADELEELALMEVGKLSSHHEQTLCFDFQWACPLSEDALLGELFIIATKSEYIDDRSAILRKAGLHISAIDVESQALYRVFKQFSAIQYSTFAWVYFLDESFDLYVFHQGMTLFVHHEPIEPSDTWSKQIKHVIQRFYTLKPMYVLECVILSVAQINHFEAVTPEIFEKIPSLSVDLGLNVIQVNPFERMLVANHLDRQALLLSADHFLIACGLALR